MTRNPMFHQRLKNIARRYHYIGEALQLNIINLIYCKSEEQLADIFTKALPRDRFCIFREMFDVKPVTSLEGSVDM